MTEKLKTLMHEQADSVDFVPLDLDTLVRAGDRRRRTRRLSVVAGVAAASVAAALVVPGLVGDGGHGTDPAGTGTDAAPLTWVMGSMLHDEHGTATDLGVDARALVATSVGYVLADDDGTVWSWVDGERRQVGTVDRRRTRLVADDEDTLAGWLDEEQGYVVLDQQTGEVTSYDAPEEGLFAALDAGSAYWRSATGPVVVDLATGRSTRVAGRPGHDLGDLEDGLTAVPNGEGIEVRRLDGSVVVTLPDVYSDHGDLSQDGRFYTSDADQPEVFDVESGTQVSLDLPGREFATGYQWLGPRTLAVLASVEADDSSTGELWVCQVPDGSCRQVSELAPFEDLVDTLVLPVGLPVDG